MASAPSGPPRPRARRDADDRMMHPEVLHPTRNPARALPLATGERAREGRASPLPADWIHDGGLRAFRSDAGYLGRSIAALKLYLTLVVSQDAGGGGPAPILMTYGRIAALSGLSDPLICAGKKALLDQGGTIAYRLTGLRRSAAAASLVHGCRPGSPIAVLHGFTCRKAPHLAALKTYLLLCACGSDPDGVVSLDVDAASDLTGTSHVRIIAALDALRQLGLADAQGSLSRLAEHRRVRLLPLR
jgi:hypothetical protein